MKYFRPNFNEMLGTLSETPKAIARPKTGVVEEEERNGCRETGISRIN